VLGASNYTYAEATFTQSLPVCRAVTKPATGASALCWCGRC